MKVSVTDGVRTVNLLVNASTNDFERFLREFADVKVVPIPSARHVARELILFDGIKRNVKVYPLSPSEECESEIHVDFKRGEMTFNFKGKEVKLKLRTENPYHCLQRLSRRNMDEDDDQFHEELLELESLFSNRPRDLRVAFAAVANATERMLERMKRNHEYIKDYYRDPPEGKGVKRLIVIEANGEGVVLEAWTILPHEVEEIIQEKLTTAQDGEDVPTYATIAREVVRSLFSLPTDIAPTDIFVKELYDECVYVDISNGGVLPL